MNKRLLCISLMASFTSASFASGEPVESVETPPVPASVLRESEQGMLETVRVQPGVNAVIPIATGHLNRLVLPFDDPSIRTVNPATTQLEGRVLYVAPSDENPVTLYVTPGHTEELALSLTLAPKKIPPREIHLTLDSETQRKLRQQRTSAFVGPAVDPFQPDHKSQDYISELKSVFKSLAIGQSPQGFNLRAPEPGEVLHCGQKGIQFKVGQVLEGRDMRVLVGVARNPGTVPIELDERRCASSSDTLAVAAWPSPRLEPGHASEIFVAVRHHPDTLMADRPSLLGELP